MSLIAPSLLASDFLHLEEVCKMLNESEGGLVPPGRNGWKICP